MKKENAVLQKSYDFSVRIIKLYKYLTDTQKEFVLAKQLVRSGTSIGANVEEAVGAQSDKDFLSKISIAYKETRETHYWIRLLRDTEILTNIQAEFLLTDCEELQKIIGSIQLTMKNKIDKNPK